VLDVLGFERVVGGQMGLSQLKRTFGRQVVVGFGMRIEFGLVVGTRTALGTWIVGTGMVELVVGRRVEIVVGIQTIEVEMWSEIHFGMVVDKLTVVGEQTSMMSDWRMIVYEIIEVTWSAYVVR
jgi:predicted acyltransferase (DUF342 family)